MGVYLKNINLVINCGINMPTLVVNTQQIIIYVCI